LQKKCRPLAQDELAGPTFGTITAAERPTRDIDITAHLHGGEHHPLYLQLA
jgi:hypothetical protein